MVYTYLDSINVNPFKYNSDEEIINYINKSDEENSKYKTRKRSAFLTEMYQLWFKDIKGLFKLFIKIFDEGFTLQRFTIERNIENIVNNFNSFGILTTKSINSGICENDVYNLISWLMNKFHPKILNEEITEVIQEFEYDLKESKEIMPLAIEFVSVNEAIFNYYKSNSSGFVEIDFDTKDLLGRFFGFITEFRKLI